MKKLTILLVALLTIVLVAGCTHKRDLPTESTAAPAIGATEETAVAESDHETVEAINPGSEGEGATEPKPTESQSTEPKPTESQSTEPKPTESQSTEPKPTESQSTEPRPTESKPTESKPTETKPTEAKPSETTPPVTENGRENESEIG